MSPATDRTKIWPQQSQIGSSQSSSPQRLHISKRFWLAASTVPIAHRARPTLGKNTAWRRR
jgi:hypothetical protein